MEINYYLFIGNLTAFYKLFLFMFVKLYASELLEVNTYRHTDRHSNFGTLPQNLTLLSLRGGALHRTT